MATEKPVIAKRERLLVARPLVEIDKRTRRQEDWQRIREQVVAKIWDFLDGMRAGRFIVDPSERTKTCRFCDYAAVCRYDRDRIDRKKKSV